MIRMRNLPHLGNVLVLVILLSIVVDENTTHSEIRQYRGVFFLKKINHLITRPCWGPAEVLPNILAAHSC